MKKIIEKLNGTKEKKEEKIVETEKTLKSMFSKGNVEKIRKENEKKERLKNLIATAIKEKRVVFFTKENYETNIIGKNYYEVRRAGYAYCHEYLVTFTAGKISPYGDVKMPYEQEKILGETQYASGLKPERKYFSKVNY